MCSPSQTGPSVMNCSVSGLSSSSNLQAICSFPLVGFLDEDKGRTRYDGRARADERDVRILDLAFPGASRRLQGALDDMPQAVDAPRGKAPTEGIERQLAAELDAAVLNEVEGLAFLAEPVGLETVEDGGGEAVIDLRDVDIFRTETRARPREFRRAAAAFHVIREAADAAGHLEAQALAVTRQVRRARLQIA